MKRVLMIEDNENNRYLTRFILEKNGYEVIEAVDGYSTPRHRRHGGHEEDKGI